MWRCDPPTRIVLAALAGLVGAALHVAPLALVAPLFGRPRLALLAAAALGAGWGAMQVGSLEQRTLSSGPHVGVVVVTGRPAGSQAIARVAGAGEDVVLRARGAALVQGGIYRVRGRLSPIDPDLRGYYATQGAHLRLTASDPILLGRRGGLCGGRLGS